MSENSVIATEYRPANQQKYQALLSEGLSAPMARLLSSRGASTFSSGILPGDSMKNLKEMAGKLLDIRKGTRFIVLADYDCDGATACAVMIRGMRGMGFDIDFVVPDRMIHGYGLTPSIVRQIHEQEAPDAIITVDNGITSFAGIEEAKKLGMKVFVTDHHHPGATIPDAESLINPSQPGCEFPSKSIAGCGVAWYLIREMADQARERGLIRNFSADTLLPYVALGTIADVVALDDNNRAIVSRGMALIRAGRCSAGIQALAAVSKKELKLLTTTDIAFGLGPRINAAGRLESMNTGINCLLSDDKAQAEYLAGELNEINEQRKELNNEAVDEAMASLGDVPKNVKCLAILGETWHEGIVGIVAGRLKEHLNRPVFVFTKNKEGLLKGSGRSVEGIHLKHVIDDIALRIPDQIVAYGGHAMAAGITMKSVDISDFSRHFEEIVAASGIEFKDKVVVSDGVLEPGEMTRQLIDDIYEGVWGAAFPEPIFSGDFTVLSGTRVGADKSHMKLLLGTGGLEVDAIWFRCEHDLSVGDTVRVNYRVSLNSWRGETTPQIMIDGDSSYPVERKSISYSKPRM